MATDKQIKANRRSARLSTGPRSGEGKMIVSRNAIRHGLLTDQVYVTEEMQEGFLKLQESFYNEYSPESSLECFLLDRVISCAWRLILLTKVEAEMFESVATSWGSNLRAAFQGNSCVYMSIISRYEKAIENSLYRAIEKVKITRTIEVSAADEPA